MNAWERGKICIIGALLWHDVNGGNVGSLTWMCGVSDPLDPIKPMDVGVICLNNLLVTFPSTTPLLLAMSLINNHTFECSMGHQISQEDARFHLHMSNG